MSNIVYLKDFVSYTLDDLAVIIPHPNNYPRRWEWFWPQYIKNTPEQVVQNTIVVYHLRYGVDNKDFAPTISAGQATVINYERDARSLVLPFTEGLSHTNKRIVARIADDVELMTDQWAEEIVRMYNEEPHLKIIASPTVGGPAFHQISNVFTEPWEKKLLRQGDYVGIEYIHGSVIVANLALWKGYYSDMLKYTLHGAEDIFFTVWSHADGVKVESMQCSSVGLLFAHRGPSNQDRIVGIHDA